jgi:hypothetical protein
MNAERIFGFAAVALVAAGLVLAFLLIGTPGHARLVALDARRVDDLQNIAVELNNRFGYGDTALPVHLPREVVRKDPRTKQPYEYRRLSARDYELCAVFALGSPRDDTAAGDDVTPFGRVWRHGAGRTCYKLNDRTRDVDPQMINGA